LSQVEIEALERDMPLRSSLDAFHVEVAVATESWDAIDRAWKMEVEERKAKKYKAPVIPFDAHPKSMQIGDLYFDHKGNPMWYSYDPRLPHGWWPYSYQPTKKVDAFAREKKMSEAKAPRCYDPDFVVPEEHECSPQVLAALRHINKLLRKKELKLDSIPHFRRILRQYVENGVSESRPPLFQG
jgi:hypothetical protein